MPVEVTTLLPFDTKLVCGLCGAPAALRRPDNSVWCARCDVAVRAVADKAETDRDRYRAGLATIAQHHPTWQGPRVNTAPNRAQLIEVAFRSLFPEDRAGGRVE